MMDFLKEARCMHRFEKAEKFVSMVKLPINDKYPYEVAVKFDNDIEVIGRYKTEAEALDDYLKEVAKLGE